MSPVHILPPELLTHVFHLGTASPENESGQDDLPALVSLVCRSWHALALSTPTLWNTLVIADSDLPPIHKLRTHLARSQSAPLNLYLDFSTHARADDVTSMLHMLLPDLDRWRHLVLVIPAFDVMYTAATMLSNKHSSKLKVLRLYGPPEFDPSEPEPPNLPAPIKLVSGPRLRDVVLCGTPVDWASFLPTTLERLQLSLHSGSRRPSFAQFARLARSPNLHTLILNASGPILSSDDERVPLEALHSLTLDCFEPDYVERLLKNIHTPSLRSLALADAAFDSSRVFEALHQPRLTTLKITSVECSPAAFRQLVKGLPNLTNVKLDARDADPSVLGTMAEATKGTCPQLRTVTCTGVPGQAIREFVERRIKAEVPVRTIRVCGALSQEDQTWLEQHVELEYFEEDEDEEIDGGAWWSTWEA